jgi:hypothetical protein
VEIAEALGGLAMLPYIAGSHPLAEKFVCCHFGNSFRHPFVHGDSLANQFDSSFLIGFICKEIPHNSRSSLGIESHNPHVPTCCHLRTVYLPALNPIADLFNWRTPGLLLVVWFAHDRRFVGLVLVFVRGGIVLPTMATRLHSTNPVETTFCVMSAPVGCRDTHGRILARKLGGRQSVCIGGGAPPNSEGHA